MYAQAQLPTARVVAHAPTEQRLAFIRKTYAHLAGAVLAFALIELTLFSSGAAAQLTALMLGRGSWLVVLGLFMLVGWLADKWARNATSVPMQYLGLGLYVVAEAIIFVPLLFIASTMSAPNVIPTAGLITGIVFAGLSAVVMISKKDFSGLRSYLAIGGFAALGLIAASLLFGLDLGTWFAVGMVVLAAGSIVYSTSNVLHHYPVGSHVAAALGLFASVALLFYYVLILLMNSRD